MGWETWKNRNSLKMTIETYEKAYGIYNAIRKLEYYIDCIEQNTVYLCNYGSGDYESLIDLDEEMKKFIKERLINIKDSYYKELSEL